MGKESTVFALAAIVIAVTTLAALYSSDRNAIAAQSSTQTRIYLLEKDSHLRFQSPDRKQIKVDTLKQSPSFQSTQSCTDHDARPECIAQTKLESKQQRVDPPRIKLPLVTPGIEQSSNLRPSLATLTNSTVSSINNQSIVKTDPPPLPKLNFTIENADVCHKRQPVLLIWVFTATGNFAKRSAIRATWGDVTRYLPMKVVVVFSLAMPKDLEGLQPKLLREQTEYGDLIQDGTFFDAYVNLTYKAQSMLRWTATYCNDVKLLFKVDDDSFLIPMRVTKWLQTFEENNSWPNNSVIGSIWQNHHAVRNGKWGTKKEDWPELIYAKKACPGSGYLITGDVVPKLVNTINQVRFLWLEDMFTTGVLGEKAGVKYINNAVHHKLLYTRNEADQNRTQSNPNIFLLGHLPGAEETLKYWSKVEKFTA